MYFSESLGCPEHILAIDVYWNCLSRYKKEKRIHIIREDGYSSTGTPFSIADPTTKYKITKDKFEFLEILWYKDDWPQF